MGRSFSSGGPKGAVNGKPTARLRAHNHAEGLTRRLRRGRRGFRPEGGQYFLSKRKKVPKKARGTATPEAARPASRRGLRPAVAPSGLSSASARCAHPPEKGFYCPFCRRGSQRRAQFSWTDNSYAYARSCARLFPPTKWAGLFTFAAYRRSAPPPLGWGRNRNGVGWNISSTHGCFCRACVRQDLGSFCPYLQRKANFPRRQARAVAPVVPRRSVRDCYREPDQTRDPRGPSPSGGIYAANWRVSRALPRPMGAVWGAGGHPLLSRRWPARWCCSRRKPSDKSRRPLPYRSLC